MTSFSDIMKGQTLKKLNTYLIDFQYVSLILFGFTLYKYCNGYTKLFLSTVFKFEVDIYSPPQNVISNEI